MFIFFTSRPAGAATERGSSRAAAFVGAIGSPHDQQYSPQSWPGSIDQGCGATAARSDSGGGLQSGGVKTYRDGEDVHDVLSRGHGVPPLLRVERVDALLESRAPATRECLHVLLWQLRRRLTSSL